MKRIILSIALITTLFSCKKEITQQSEPAKISTVSQVKPSGANFSVDKQKLFSLLNGKNKSFRVAVENDFKDEDILANLNDYLDSVGAWHNEMMDYYINNMVTEEATLCDTADFRKKFNTYSIDFLATKGIYFTGDALSYETETPDLQHPLDELSNEANEYVNTLNNIISSDVEVEEMVSQLEELKEKCLSQLSDNKEKIIVGTGIAVAKYSALYWSSNYSNWDGYFSNLPCSPKQQQQMKLRPDEVKILQKDVSGAIGGAFGGGLGGPAGAVAGALVVGGFNSCREAVFIGFGISHITDWFPF